MVTILPKDDRWSGVFSDLIPSLTEGYTKRADQNAIQKAIEGLGENPKAQDVLNAITGVKAYNNENKKDVLKNYTGAAEIESTERRHKETLANQRELAQIRKAQAEIQANAKVKAEEIKVNAKATKEEDKKTEDREAVSKLVDQLDVSDEQKEALRGAASLPQAQKLLTDQITGDKKLNLPDRINTENNVKEYIELSKELPKFQKTNEIVDQVKKLSDKLGWYGGVAELFGTESATELEGLSFALLAPVIKLYNPTGVLAQRKLELLKDMYHIKASDSPWKRSGKLKALAGFNRQAELATKRRMKLLHDSNYLPSPEQLQGIDKEMDDMVDAMVNYDFEGKEVDGEKIGLPAPNKVKKGAKIVNQATGETYYSDGERWLIK